MRKRYYTLSHLLNYFMNLCALELKNIFIIREIKLSCKNSKIMEAGMSIKRTMMSEPHCIGPQQKVQYGGGVQNTGAVELPDERN